MRRWCGEVGRESLEPQVEGGDEEGQLSAGRNFTSACLCIMNI